jgi:hypothetical protein
MFSDQSRSITQANFYGAKAAKPILAMYELEPTFIFTLRDDVFRTVKKPANFGRMS